MTTKIRNELLSDLRELQKLESQNNLYQRSMPYSFAPTSYVPPLVSSQRVNYGPSQVYPQSRAIPNCQPLQSNLVYSQVLPQNPAQESLPVQQNLVGSQVVSGLRESIKGENYFEYVPFEKVIIEQEEKRKKEMIDVRKNKTDYYAVEKQVEYVPYTKYETIEEVVPQQRTEYIAQSYIEYIPEVSTEMVPVDRVQEKVEYQQVHKKIVHYPKFDQEFTIEAEKSGNILQNPGLFNSQIVNGPQTVPLQKTGLFNSQMVTIPNQSLATFPVRTQAPQVILPRSTPNVYQSQILTPSVFPLPTGLVNSQFKGVQPRYNLGTSKQPMAWSSQRIPTKQSKPYFFTGVERDSINLTKKKKAY